MVIVNEYTAIAGTPDVGEDVVKEVEADVDREEESSCTRLLAAAAERVWDIFLQNKREVRKFCFPSCLFVTRCSIVKSMGLGSYLCNYSLVGTSRK